MAYQHWDLMGHIGANYFEGVVTGYIWQWRKNNRSDDLKKAKFFLDTYSKLPVEVYNPGPKWNRPVVLLRAWGEINAVHEDDLAIIIAVLTGDLASAALGLDMLIDKAN